MTPRRQSNKLNLPLLFSVISFVVGYGINALMNYASYANKVDQLTATIVEMREDLKDRQTRSADFHQKTNSRLTALEVKVFGQVQQVSLPAQPNYTAFNN